MTNKEYLGQIREYDCKIRASMEYIASLRSMATKISAVLSDMPGTGAVNKSRQEEILVKIVMLEEAIDKDVSEMMRLRMEIEDAAYTKWLDIG